MGNVTNRRKTEEIDQEWVELIAEALRMGMTIEKVRVFLQTTNGNSENKQHVIKSYKVSGI